MCWDVDYGQSEWKGRICGELSEGMIDVCYLQEVRWRGQSSKMLGMEGRRY